MSDLTSYDIVTRINTALDGTTPGPWRQVNGLYDDSDGGCEVWADRDAAGWDAFMVATTLTRLNPNPTSHAAEDARLIAAAPSLLREAAAEIERLRATPDPSACEHEFEDRCAICGVPAHEWFKDGAR